MTCACSCGSVVSSGRRFVSGHNLKGLERTEEHRRRIGDAQRIAWSTKRARKPLGTVRADRHGYRLVKTLVGTGRWDKEHVLVVEAGIGRRLVAGEQVHHINGLRDDNRPENLFLCAGSSEHAKIEWSLKRIVRSLLDDGIVVFDRERKVYRRA